MDRLSSKGQMIDQIDLRSVPHSGFDRSNHNYGTGKLGTLLCTRLDEVYPGDRIKGKPEMVVNFEPLAAPLMGSMVLKQESFFVPYIQLWRHAYKFFTGKNEFSDPMPSISPKDVFDVYCNFHHWDTFISLGQDYQQTKGLANVVYSLSVFYSVLGTHPGTKFSEEFGFTLYDRMKYWLNVTKAKYNTLFNPYKMLDLVSRALSSFEDFVESKELEDFHVEFESGHCSQNSVLALGKRLGQIMQDMFVYFHGPSSLFDYLGWPVPTDYKVYSEGREFVVSQNLFEYAVYRNILIYGSVNLKEDYLDPLFSEVPLNFMPFKAYYLIWYWNYRDQLLETGILDPEEDDFLGTTITDEMVVYCTINRQRCWFKDTFTTALTNTGDGNLIVPIKSIDSDYEVKFYDGDRLVDTTDERSAYAAGATIASYTFDGHEYNIPMRYLGAANYDLGYSNDDLENYVSLDLFDRIKRLRSFVQKRLILGYEVDDVIWSSFMVKLSNVRMHIPEILGRGRDAVQINTIVNNTTTQQQIAGDKTATAWAHGLQSEMDYFSEEWGLFLTISTIMPIPSYAGGMQRLYLKKDPLDFAWPEFATMGMDAVYKTELASLGTRLTDQQGLEVFGYQGRYYDLKSRLDEEHGRILTDLNYLTFSREWDRDNPPQLNYIFVHCWPRLDGFVIESPLIDVFRYDCYNAHAWERRLPVPSTIV